MSETRPQFLVWMKRKSDTLSGSDVTNLASSGVLTSFAEQWQLNTITNRSAQIVERLNEPHQFGLISLKQAIRAAYELPLDREIVCTSGASGAIRLVSEFLLARRSGAEIVVETPCYEPLCAIPERLGAKIVLADRSNFMPTVVRSVTDRTMAIFLSNPHNPTGHWLNHEDLLNLSGELERFGSRSLIVADETFCDVGPQPGTTAAVVDRRIITISSLSKSCGLPSLCCGWVTTDPGIVPGFVEGAVLFQNIGCKIAEILGSLALDEIDSFRQVAKDHVDRNRALVSAWLEDMANAALIAPQSAPAGCVIFLRPLISGSTAELVKQLEERFGVLVVPGCFFGDTYDDHIRIGIGGNSDELQMGLSRLAAGLAALRENAL